MNIIKLGYSTYNALIIEINICRYNSLSNIQDLDPIDAAHLKIIENNINYVQSQIEKGDKQLDELWFKFKENISR